MYINALCVLIQKGLYTQHYYCIYTFININISAVESPPCEDEALRAGVITESVIIFILLLLLIILSTAMLWKRYKGRKPNWKVQESLLL